MLTDPKIGTIMELALIELNVGPSAAIDPCLPGLVPIGVIKETVEHLPSTRDKATKYPTNRGVLAPHSGT
jgi:hypothetical protein